MKKLLILPAFVLMFITSGQTVHAGYCGFLDYQESCNPNLPGGNGNPGGGCPPITLFIPEDSPCQD